eukprot:6191524-Pleurochrysis_carterae.AAC.4
MLTLARVPPLQARADAGDGEDWHRRPGVPAVAARAQASGHAAPPGRRGASARASGACARSPAQ